MFATPKPQAAKTPIVQSTASRPNLWCTGEDSNLRSSKERQIYSLLPLTTRPPVHNAALRPKIFRTGRRHDSAAASSVHDGRQTTIGKCVPKSGVMNFARQISFPQLEMEKGIEYLTLCL